MAFHIDEFNVITIVLSYVEFTFEAEVIALILLSSIPKSWSAMVTASYRSIGKSKPKLDDTRDMVLSEDVSMKEFGFF